MKRFPEHSIKPPQLIRSAAELEKTKFSGREVLKAIEAEPEFPGSMSEEMWDKIRDSKDVAEAAMRIAVKLTKKGIAQRLKLSYRDA